jgi:lysozyme family protein
VPIIKSAGVLHFGSELRDAMSCDELPSGVDYAVFDYGVNSGISRAAKVLQRLVGTDVDGEIGPNTIAATTTLPVDPKNAGRTNLR